MRTPYRHFRTIISWGVPAALVLAVMLVLKCGPPHNNNGYAARYSCNGTACIADTYGMYTTNTCNNSCSATGTYSCSGSSCVPDPYGTHTHSNCDNACTYGTPATYACNGTSCVASATGTYSTSSCNNACACSPSTGTVTNTVTIMDYAFTPSCIVVTSGHTITWTNMGVVNHTVTSDTGTPEAFNSGTIVPSGTWSHALTITGTDTYHCSIHTYMTGTIFVQ